MKKLQISLSNKQRTVKVKGKKKTVGTDAASSFSIAILDGAESFSAKQVRKLMHCQILRIMHQKDFAKGISAGQQVHVVATFDEISVPFAPIYFGGLKGADKLKKQLAVFVVDLKEFIEEAKPAKPAK